MKLILLFAAWSAIAFADAQDVNLNPQPHLDPPPPTKTKKRTSVPQLKELSRYCDIAGHRYALDEDLDSNRCIQRGGKVKDAAGAQNSVPSIKVAPAPEPHHTWGPNDDRTNPQRNYDPTAE